MAPHNIIDAEHRFTESAYAKYFHLLSLEEKKALFKTRAITNYITFFRAFIIEKFKGDFYKTDSGKHKQQSLNKQAVLEESSLKQRIKYQYYKGDTLTKRITRDSLYYKKLIELAAAENITIEFISTPTFHGYEELIPGEIKNIFKDFITTNKIPYKNLSSYKQLDLYPDNFILDGDHLSIKGSKQFTDYLINHKNFN